MVGFGRRMGSAWPWLKKSFTKHGKWMLLGGGIGLGCAAMLAGALIFLHGGGAMAVKLGFSGEAVYGKPVVMDVTVENGGWFRAKYSAALLADGGDAVVQEIVLEPKESRTLTMEVTGLSPGAHTMALDGMEREITVLRPAGFRVTGLTVKPETIQPGESVKAEATVENTGEMPGDYTAVFSLDGIRTETAKAAIEPGATRKITVTLKTDTRGEHTVEAGGLSRPFSALAPAKVGISGLQLSAPYMQPKGTVEAYVYLTNDGDYDGAGSAELFVDGVSCGVQEASVGAGGRVCCVYRITEAKEGTYTVRAGDFEQKLEVLALSRPGTGAMFAKGANGGGNTLKIRNQTNVDAIITLASTSSPGMSALSFYLRAGEKSGSIHVKDGTYYVYYALGADYSAKYKKLMTVYGYRKKGTYVFETTTTTKWVWSDEAYYDYEYDFWMEDYVSVKVYHYSNYDITIGANDGSMTSEASYPK